MLVASPKFLKGFTLIEILVVVGIIAALAAIVFAALVGIQRKARAAQVLATYKEIDKAWDAWLVDNGVSGFLRQDVYDETACRVVCDAWTHDEPCLSLTDLFQNIVGRPGWRGPYLPAIPKTPIGNEYTYDNDGDVWPQDGKSAGVNLMVQWCSDVDGDDVRSAAERIDTEIDDGNGKDNGLVRWSSGNPGSLRLLLDPGE